MFLYSITIIPLEEELQAADLGILIPFNTDDAAFDESERRSAHILKLLMERGPEKGYFLEQSKSVFIADTPGKKGKKGILQRDRWTRNL